MMERRLGVWCSMIIAVAGASLGVACTSDDSSAAAAASSHEGAAGATKGGAAGTARSGGFSGAGADHGASSGASGTSGSRGDAGGSGGSEGASNEGGAAGSDGAAGSASSSDGAAGSASGSGGAADGAGGTGGSAALSTGPGFPRIASYYIETYVGPDQQATMSRSSLVIVDAESAALDPTPLEGIRSANPQAALLAYLTSEEISREPDPSEQPLAAERFTKIASKHWLLEPGSSLSSAISATATHIKVADASAFSVVRPPSDFYDDDEPTYLLVDDENMKLVGVTAKELVVERGYQSEATAHAAGTPIAAHVVFFAGTWMLDLAKSAPADPVQGTWRDLLVEQAKQLVASGPWTGVFLDVCFEDVSWLNGGVLDVDRDGVADDPTEASKQWSLGMEDVVDTLRAQLGPDVPLIANPGAQDCPHPKLDGILMEGWPIGMPPDYLAFDVGLSRYLTWSKAGRGLTVANGFSTKIGFGTIEPGDDAIAQTDYAAMRFGLGVALLGDGYYTFDNGVFGHNVAWWYDEYDGGGLGAGWLGMPLADPLSQGALSTREFEHGFVVVNTGDAAATVSVPAGFAKLQGTQDPAHNDGSSVTAPLSVAAHDAYLLRRL